MKSKLYARTEIRMGIAHPKYGPADTPLLRELVIDFPIFCIRVVTSKTEVNNGYSVIICQTTLANASKF